MALAILMRSPSRTASSLATWSGGAAVAGGGGGRRRAGARGGRAGGRGRGRGGRGRRRGRLRRGGRGLDLRVRGSAGCQEQAEPCDEERGAYRRTHFMKIPCSPVGGGISTTPAGRVE